VILAFATPEIRLICESQVAAEREFDTEIAQQLRARLADMKAAENILDLAVGNPREIYEGENCYYTIQLPGGFRIIMCANHESVPRVPESNRTDWSQVRRFQILRIEKELGNG
jgi:plasmid maintenance system killer protein